MLLSKRAGSTSVGFAVGWLAGIVVATAIFVTLAGTMSTSDDGPSINPKNLLMCIAAGVTIGGASLSLGQQIGSVAIFTVIAASTVAIPVIGYLVAAQKLRAPLDELKQWLQANNATVIAVLMLVIGVVLIGKGIGGL